MSTGGTLRELPQRLHHSARIIRDQESNRQLVEGILGIPLAATWVEHVPDYENPARTVVFCHTFYELADGSALAFFQFEKPEHRERVAPELRERTGQYDHAALKVSDATFEELVARLQGADFPYRILDHGYCRSLYVRSDQGYTLEFASDPPGSEKILRWQRQSAREALDRWTKGDRSTNNDLRDKSYEA